MFTDNSNTYLFPSPTLDIFPGHHYSIPVLAEKKQATATVKKDRNSKIFTSQGPRDRRVRLSIGIARKFFDLQEMLGFDKPSKTLDWLLTKSKAAIKDLVMAKDNNNGEDSQASKKKGVAPNSSFSLAKAESRAKARARARERTREKMCMKEKLKKGGELISPFNNYNPDPVGVFHQRNKTKSPSSSFFGFHQNVFVSGHENWDVCSFTSILDQHKFMNR